MTTLPNNLTRYTGDGCDAAVDYDGKWFYAFQGPNDTARLVMEYDGTIEEIPINPPMWGRPRLAVDPFLGLWISGAKAFSSESNSTTTPLMMRVQQYTTRPLPPQLAGAWQHEPNTIELGTDGCPHAYVDLSAGAYVDYGFRIITFADGHSEIIHAGAGPLIIRVNGREIVLE